MSDRIAILVVVTLLPLGIADFAMAAQHEAPVASGKQYAVCPVFVAPEEARWGLGILKEAMASTPSGWQKDGVRLPAPRFSGASESNAWRGCDYFVEVEPKEPHSSDPQYERWIPGWQPVKYFRFLLSFKQRLDGERLLYCILSLAEERPGGAAARCQGEPYGAINAVVALAAQRGIALPPMQEVQMGHWSCTRPSS